MGIIFDSLVEFDSQLLDEQILDEDKMVKFGGELSPKFGWCVMYIGGAASGKGSASNFLSRIQGRTYNVDELKEVRRIWDITNPHTGDSYKSDFSREVDGVPTSELMKDSDFVSELHTTMKPLSKKWKKSILDNPEDRGNGRERLPNIIFDMTGDDIKKITEIVDTVKPIGYKVAIVWMLSTFEKALGNNKTRSRSVGDTVVADTHSGVLTAVTELFNSGKIEDIDDFWVIDTAVELNLKDAEGKRNRQGEVDYHNLENVYHIPCTKEGLKKFDFIINRMEFNKDSLDKFYANN